MFVSSEVYEVTVVWREYLIWSTYGSSFDGMSVGVHIMRVLGDGTSLVSQIMTVLMWETQF